MFMAWVILNLVAKLWLAKLRPNSKASVSVMPSIDFICALGMVREMFCPLTRSHLKGGYPCTYYTWNGWVFFCLFLFFCFSFFSFLL